MEQKARSLDGFQELDSIVLTLEIVLAMLLGDESDPDPPPSGGMVPALE